MDIKISPADLETFIWMARRYANGRHTYAPAEFNEALDRVYTENPELTMKFDPIDELTHWPHARVGGVKKEGSNL